MADNRLSEFLPRHSGRMNLRSRRILALLLMFAIAVVIYVAFFSAPSIYRFTDLNGPSPESVVEQEIATPVTTYGKGSASRIALLVTNPDSDWLGMVHGLKTIGVPLVATQDYQEAIKHKVVMAYPTISGKLLAPAALRALAAHPQRGGTLIGFEILGGGLNEVFGFKESSAATNRKSMKFDKQASRTLALTDPQEEEIPLAGPSGGMGTYSYTLSGGTSLAQYDNGGTAIVRHDIADGHAYAFGFDVGAYIAKAYNGRQDLGKSYINAYEPAVDVLLRTLHHIYRTSEPLAVTLGTVPDNKSASIIITHDVDYTRSIENAIQYAEYERSQNVRATYFIQTKYVKDWNDDIFFNAHGADLTRHLSEMKMEIASHSVAHSRVFSKFPLGTGKERYPTYVPFVKSKLETKDGTILGELRASRFLLESAVPELKVQSFRPGHLEYPYALPQALQATGYRFNSSLASGVALTHLPFQLNFNRENHSETPIFEFPLTLEDERQRPMTARFKDAQAILTKLQQYGGSCVVLIHPDVFDDKLEFLKSLIAHGKATNAWFGTLGEFGQWWSARNQIAVDVRQLNGRYVLETDIPASASGVTLHLPAGWTLDAQEISSGNALQLADKVVLSGVVGKVKLYFIKQT